MTLNTIKVKSTTTLSLRLQTLLDWALKMYKHALMTSVDLSAAFDVVNIDLLLVRLKLIGLPADLVDLIEVWLRNRFFYVEVDDHNSKLHQINSGTIQGSTLSTIFYAIYLIIYYSKCPKSERLDFGILENGLVVESFGIRTFGWLTLQHSVDF